MLNIAKIQSRPCLHCMRVRNTLGFRLLGPSIRRQGSVAGCNWSSRSKDSDGSPYHSARDNIIFKHYTGHTYQHNGPIIDPHIVGYSVNAVKYPLPWISHFRRFSTSSSLCYNRILSHAKPKVTGILGNDSLPNVRFHSRSAASQKDVDEDRGWTAPKGLDTGIKMYNSLSRKKEPLILPMGRHVSWYACGPTVYDHAHIGHASSYVRMDIIRRVLMDHFNLDVVLAMGVTDIDDKIIKRSKEAGVTYRHLTRAFEDEFFKDMDALNVLPPTVKLRVTEHLPQINYFIDRLIKNGFAYVTPGGTVYFDVQMYGRYGRLWTHRLDTQIRESLDKDKKGPRDFALWKAAKPDEPSWESPWGMGRPGWHIECSTMASTIFGERLDIHSGGDDLRFPHHENEMAQSEACFCSRQWTNYWLHTGHLHLKNDKTKMSKSLNNTINVGELLTRTTAGQFRLFCMLRPYRQLVEYSSESLQKAVRLHDSWMSFLALGDAYVRGNVDTQAINEPHLLEQLGKTKTKVDVALADDFDTPKAIHAIEDLIRAVNTELNTRGGPEEPFVSRSPGTVASVIAYVERMFKVFGLNPPKKKNTTANPHVVGLSESDVRIAGVMDTVIKFRGQVRDYALNPAPLPVADPLGTKAEPGESKAAENTNPKKEPPKNNQKIVPLLKACDQLRDELNLTGINIQDHGKTARWYFMDKILPRKKT